MTLEDGWLKLVTSPSSTSRLATLDRATISHRALLHTNFFSNLYQRHGDITLKTDCLQLSASPPQLLLASALLEGVRQEKTLDLATLQQEASTPQPALSLLLSSPSLSYTWTQQLFTLSLSCDTLSLSLRPPGKAKPLPLLSGLPPLPRSKVPWLLLTLQWPLGSSSSSTMPSLLLLHTGETSLLWEPRVGELLATWLKQQEQEIRPGFGGGDLSTERSSRAAVPLSPSPPFSPVLSTLQNLLVDISLSRLSLHLSSRPLPGSSSSVGELVARVSRSSSLPLLSLVLEAVTVHQASGRVDLSQYSSHPVLLPPGVWGPARDLLPWSLALSSLSLERPGASPSTLMRPLTTRCTLGASPSPHTQEALCLHADLSPLEVSLDRSGLSTLAAVASSLASCLLAFSSPAPVPPPLQVTRPVPGPPLLQRSVGSVSESALTSTQQSSLGPSSTTSPQAPSLWLQWTLPLASLTLLLPQDTLTVNLEDCSASLDRQAAYIKCQARLRSLSCSLAGAGGQPAPWPGHILACRSLLRPLYVHSPDTGAVEELEQEEEQEEGRGVFTLTLTCAEVAGLTKRLRPAGTKDKPLLVDASFQPPRYLTEFDIELRPVDVFLPMRLLQPLFTFLQPLSEVKLPSAPGPASSLSSSLLQYNSSTLPMLYLKTGRLRLFLLLLPAPDPEPVPDPLVPDFMLLQLQRAVLTSCVENPLSR